MRSSSLLGELTIELLERRQVEGFRGQRHRCGGGAREHRPARQRRRGLQAQRERRDAKHIILE